MQGRIDRDQLVALLRWLGAASVRPKTEKIESTCLLARWTHPGGDDMRPSMVVFVGDDERGPTYKCLACGSGGSLRELVLDLWALSGRNLTRAVMWLDGELPQLEPKGETADTAGHGEIGQTGHTESAATEPPNRDGDLVRLLLRAASSSEPKSKRKPTRHTVPSIDWSRYDPYCLYKLPPPPWSDEELLEAESKAPLHPYLLERGLDERTCRTFALGFDASTRRILFPVFDVSGRLVAISGRLVADRCVKCGGELEKWSCTVCGRSQGPKYLHSEGFPRRYVLYGEHRLGIDRNHKGVCYLVEGHIDMLVMWQRGYRPVVAALGSNIAEQQAEKLIDHGPGRIVVVSDGDEAGRKLASGLRSYVSDRVHVGEVPLPPGEDPASIDPQMLTSILGPPPASPSNLHPGADRLADQRIARISQPSARWIGSA